MKHSFLIFFYFILGILYQAHGSQITSHQLPIINQAPEYEQNVFSAIQENDIKKLDNALAILGKYCKSDSILTDTKALLSYDITLTNNIGMSPLMYAVFRASPEMCSYLLEKKAPTNVKQEGSNNNIWDILRNEATTLLRWENDKTSPLTPLQQKQLHRVAHVLLKHNVDYDEYENNWRNIGRCQYPKKIKLPDWLDELIEVNQQNEYYNTPLVSELKGACKDLVAIQSLIDKGADVNRHTTHEDPPLFYSYTQSVAKLLLDNGADINILNREGNTLLHQCCSENKEDVVEFLLNNHANPNQPNCQGITPLFFRDKKDFQKRYNPKILKLLLDYKADINPPNNKTPLLSKIMTENYCLNENDFACIRIVLNYEQPPLNIYTESGMIPLLHCAIFQKFPLDLIKFFIEENPTSINKVGLGELLVTPLHMAVYDKNFSLARLLIQYGADCSIKDHEGITPLDRVCSTLGCLDIAQLLADQPQARRMIGNRVPLLALAQLTQHNYIKNNPETLSLACNNSVQKAQIFYKNGIPDLPPDYPLPDPLDKAISLAELHGNTPLSEWMKQSRKF